MKTFAAGLLCFARLALGATSVDETDEILPRAIVGPEATCLAEVKKLLAQGERVLVVGPFYFGESKIKSHDYLSALLVTPVGERPLLALGPRSSTFSLMAAALESRGIASVELRQPLGSLKQVIENNWGVNQFPELMCFGLLEAFDIKQMAALVAPRALLIAQPDERAWQEFEGFKRVVRAPRWKAPVRRGSLTRRGHELFMRANGDKRPNVKFFPAFNTGGSIERLQHHG